MPSLWARAGRMRRLSERLKLREQLHGASAIVPARLQVHALLEMRTRHLDLLFLDIDGRNVVVRLRIVGLLPQHPAELLNSLAVIVKHCIHAPQQATGLGDIWLDLQCFLKGIPGLFVKLLVHIREAQAVRRLVAFRIDLKCLLEQ